MNTSLETCRTGARVGRVDVLWRGHTWCSEPKYALDTASKGDARVIPRAAMHVHCVLQHWLTVAQTLSAQIVVCESRNSDWVEHWRRTQ